VYEHPEKQVLRTRTTFVQFNNDELCDVYENTENMCCAQKPNSPLNAVFE